MNDKEEDSWKCESWIDIRYQNEQIVWQEKWKKRLWKEGNMLQSSAWLRTMKWKCNSPTYLFNTSSYQNDWIGWLSATPWTTYQHSQNACCSIPVSGVLCCCVAVWWGWGKKKDFGFILENIVVLFKLLLLHSYYVLCEWLSLRTWCNFAALVS